jgi:hypothetical protein
LIILLTVLVVVAVNQRNQADRLAILAQSQEEQARLALQQYEKSGKAPGTLIQQYINITLNVDAQGLIDGSSTAVNSLRDRILSTPQLMGRQAGLVLIFSGDNSSDPT